MAAKTCLLGLTRSVHLLGQCRSYGIPLCRPLLLGGVQRQSYSTENTAQVIVEPQAESGVTVVKMNRKPVNSLNLELMTELYLALEKLEGDRGCHGVILTSANPGVFSAGLDIMEMYQPQEARLREFWRTLQELFLRLYGSGLVTMAAINGHAPAGGCLLSMCCDYRVMAAPKFTIGLNETQLGIVPPFWFTNLMVNLIGHRQSEYALQMGRMFSAEEALQVGLVDKLVDIGEVIGTARKEMDTWLRVPGVARQLTKTGLRDQSIQKLISKREEDIENFINFVTKDAVQKSLGLYIESLKKRKS